MKEKPEKIPGCMGEQRPEGVTSPEKLTVEQHARAFKVDPATLAGLKALKNLAIGRKMTGAEFKKMLDDFLKSPAGGK